MPSRIVLIATLDRTTQGSEQKAEYRQPVAPKVPPYLSVAVSALPPLASRMLDPEDRNETSRQKVVPDSLSSLPSYLSLSK